MISPPELLAGGPRGPSAPGGPRGPGGPGGPWHNTIAILSVMATIHSLYIFIDYAEAAYKQT